ncbi:MAG: hypothetical protein IKO34_11160 [Bacteroidales bacterium]|nr:hypothetical protein [Bacteroidales bacterium]
MSLRFRIHHRILLFRDKVANAFIFQVSQQVDVRNLAFQDIGDCQQSKFRAGIFAGHLVAVITIRFQNHILAHQRPRIDFEFTLVVQDLSVKGVSRLRQRVSVTQLTHQHLGAGKERAFL